MFQQKYYLDDIGCNLTIISETIKTFNKINPSDLNYYAEDFFCSLLNIVFELDLINLNLLDKNIASIDLGDKNKKICYQITSTNSSQKIKNTIAKFEKYNLSDSYDELFILLLTNKKKYSTKFKTNQKYKFSTKNILDINDLFLKIKIGKLEKIETIYQFLEKNLPKFLKSNNSYNQVKSENKINSLIRALKIKAIEQYNFQIESLDVIIKECTDKYYLGIEFSNLQNIIKSAYQASLFFKSISFDEMKLLLKFINIHYAVQNEYSLEMVTEYYQQHFNENIDGYLLENIMRIFKSLRNILASEINITFSSGFGNYQELLLHDSAVLSVSNPIKNDHKLIFLNSEIEKIIEPEFCLGGISEKVINIKKITYSNNLFVCAQGFSNLYVWQPSLSYEPIVILQQEKEQRISDYDIFIFNNRLILIALTEENKIIVWELNKNQACIIREYMMIQGCYLLINLDGINKLITNNRYSKEIYEYDLTSNTIKIYFKIPNQYYSICSLSIHPKKKQIAFSCADKSYKDDSSFFLALDYNKIVQYDIALNKEFFHVQVKGHFFTEVTYLIEKEYTFLLAYDRDGAGSQLSPMIKKWQENSKNKFDLVYEYNDYPKEKNTFFEHMKLFKNKIYVNSIQEPSKINILKNNQEILFYLLYKDYYINNMFFISKS